MLTIDLLLSLFIDLSNRGELGWGANNICWAGGPEYRPKSVWELQSVRATRHYGTTCSPIRPAITTSGKFPIILFPCVGRNGQC